LNPHPEMFLINFYKLSLILIEEYKLKIEQNIYILLPIKFRCNTR